MNLEMLNQEVVACRKCPRLVAWREQVAREKRRAFLDQNYWGKPVPGFGDPAARIFIVGLAPGAHGSNRTGRQFTGDASGSFLYSALFRAGLANQPTSTAIDDGLRLVDAYTAPVCRCAPPDNKPNPDEMANCQPFLEAELRLIGPRVIVALGGIAFERVLRIYGLRKPDWKFGHGAVYRLDDGPWLLCSYHPSRQNTQTGRLTAGMFDSIWVKARELCEI
ncbi:MAG TPA: uracil-DNA glycosylase [Anaerolineales bacterium]|jgi:uracil-DNA glycosylase family 4